MTSLTFLIIGIENLVITLYRQLSYYFRVITSNTKNNNNNSNNDNDNDDNDLNNNISKYYSKIRRNDIFCFHNFGIIKSVIKLQKILSKHKQAYIPTAI